jgi:hypothetical protein
MWNTVLGACMKSVQREMIRKIQTEMSRRVDLKKIFSVLNYVTYTTELAGKQKIFTVCPFSIK